MSSTGVEAVHTSSPPSTMSVPVASVKEAKNLRIVSYEIFFALGKFYFNIP